MSALGKVNVLRTTSAAPLLLQRAHCACLRGATIYGANELNGAEGIVTADRQSLLTALNLDNFIAKPHMDVLLDALSPKPPARLINSAKLATSPPP